MLALRPILGMIRRPTVPAEVRDSAAFIARMFAYSRRAESRKCRDLSEGVAERMVEFVEACDRRCLGDATLRAIGAARGESIRLVAGQRQLDEGRPDRTYEVLGDDGRRPLHVELKIKGDLGEDQAKRYVRELLKDPSDGPGELLIVCRTATRDQVWGQVIEQMGSLRDGRAIVKTCGSACHATCCSPPDSSGRSTS